MLHKYPSSASHHLHNALQNTHYDKELVGLSPQPGRWLQGHQLCSSELSGVSNLNKKPQPKTIPARLRNSI